MGRGIGKAGGKFVSKAPRAIARTLGAGVLGAGLGTIGLAAGIASGDLGNTFKYGAAGALAGGTAGSNLASMGNIGNLKQITEEYRRGRDGDQYKAKKLKREYEKWISNNDNISVLENSMGVKEFEDVKESGEIKEYYDAGITNASEMVRLNKLQKKKMMLNGQEVKIANNAKEAIALRKASKIVGPLTGLGQTDINDKKAGYVNQMVSAGYDPSDAIRVTDDMFTRIIASERNVD